MKDIYGKDAFGNELYKGDIVAFISKYNRELKLGRVEYNTPNGSTVSYEYNGRRTKINRSYKKLCKVCGL